MAEPNVIERLDAAIDAILAGRQEGLALRDPELAALLVIAADLRDVPDPQFKQRLKADLLPGTKEEMMSTTESRLEPGFQTIRAYLVLDGASDFIQFLKDAFGAIENARFKGPGGGKIMHAEMMVGNSKLELGDAPARVSPRPGALHLYLDDIDAVYQRALRAGATSLMGPTDQFYGDREAALRDRWGNSWYIATHLADPSTKPFRKGFRSLTPYLHARGADRLMRFLKEAFGAQAVEEPTVSAQGTIAHAVLQIGDSVIELGEAHGQWQAIPMGIHLFVDDTDAVYERALRAGGKSVRPPTDMPYGERGATVADPFDNQWFIGTPR